MNMESSPLANLPGEIRNSIWRYALVEPSGVGIHVTDHKRPKLRTGIPGLPRSCRQIRKETSSIYYGENVFKICHSLRLGLYIDLAWVKAIGLAQAAQITKLVVYHSDCSGMSGTYEPLSEVRRRLLCRAAIKLRDHFEADGIQLTAVELLKSSRASVLDAEWDALGERFEELKLGRDGMHRV